MSLSAMQTHVFHVNPMDLADFTRPYGAWNSGREDAVVYVEIYCKVPIPCNSSCRRVDLSSCFNGKSGIRETFRCPCSNALALCEASYCVYLLCYYLIDRKRAC